MAGFGERIKSFVDCGSSPIKIHCFEYLKRFIDKINEIYDFSINISIAIFY